MCEYTLSSCSRDLCYGQYALISKGEDLTGGRERNSILCDLFESVLGAIYLDGGMDYARKYVYSHLLRDIEKRSLFYDAKTNLQEYVQKEYHTAIEYRLVSEMGPEHNKEYTSEVLVDGKSISVGKGQSHKASEQMAAYEALLKLKNK